MSTIRRAVLIFAGFACIPFTVSGAEIEIARPAQEFVAAHEAAIRPLEKAANLAWWNANVSGRDEDFKAKEEAQNKLDAALADRA